MLKKQQKLQVFRYSIQYGWLFYTAGKVMTVVFQHILNHSHLTLRGAGVTNIIKKNLFLCPLEVVAKSRQIG